MDHGRDREFKRKRALSFIVVSGYVFFEGCEYVVILPSAWDYLQTLGVTEEYWLGFIISSIPDSTRLSFRDREDFFLTKTPYLEDILVSS
ncbi:unnamed protein product [Allacma fusca]|uniref:Uncharacterized protein n=1 Tax=Allacma fusca TaxID=39272 RepID=A0A8J2KTJ1_9HEXA|nr:unnamed protein product [Allacma fusca]